MPQNENEKALGAVAAANEGMGARSQVQQGNNTATPGPSQQPKMLNRGARRAQAALNRKEAKEQAALGAFLGQRGVLNHIVAQWLRPEDFARAAIATPELVQDAANTIRRIADMAQPPITCTICDCEIPRNHQPRAYSFSWRDEDPSIRIVGACCAHCEALDPDTLMSRSLEWMKRNLPGFRQLEVSPTSGSA